MKRHTPACRPSAVFAAALLLAALVCVAAAPVAGAGHILHRFSVSPPDPTTQSAARPQAVNPFVYFLVADAAGGSGSSWVWTVGGPPPTLTSSFSDGLVYDADSAVAVFLVRQAAPSDLRDIWLLDESGGTHPILVGASWRVDAPVVTNDFVVWTDYRRGKGDIRGARLDPVTHEKTDEFWVCKAKGEQSAPDVGGYWAVWEDHRHGQGDIYARNLVNGATKLICGAPGPKGTPRTDGRWVVWVDYRNGAHKSGVDIYARRLGSRQVIAISRDPGQQFEPDVGGGFVTWVDHYRSHRAGTVDDTTVRGLEVSTRHRFVVDKSDGYEIHPDMDGTMLTYVSYSAFLGPQPFYGVVKVVFLKHD